MSTLRVNNVTDLGDDAVVTGGVLDTLAVPAGGILQVVRATDSTDQTTTSTSFVDANISVTITPQSNSNLIYVYAYFQQRFYHTSQGASRFQITDSSNTPLAGAENVTFFTLTSGHFSPAALLGYVAPASTSAQTYKLRFKTGAGTTYIQGAEMTTQLIAIEVAA